MSQRDLVAELRAAHVEAPSEVRERVRLIAAGAPAPPRRFTWRRALVVALPVAAAVAATVVVTRPSHEGAAVTVQHGAVRSAAAPHPSSPNAGAQLKSFSVPTDRGRVQVVGATLGLRVESARAVSDAVKRAVAIARSLGGYAASVHAETHGDHGSADLTLKVPRTHVQEALTRLSQLGTITNENVSTTDKEAELSATDRKIARLQKQLATLRAQPQTPETTQQIAALVHRVEQLQRGEASTRRAARYATVHLHLATAPVVATPRHGHGPLHGVGVALEWLGIGAVYALAIGTPVLLLLALVLLATRIVRRRRVDALLSRS